MIDASESASVEDVWTDNVPRRISIWNRHFTLIAIGLVTVGLVAGACGGADGPGSDSDYLKGVCEAFGRAEGALAYLEDAERCDAHLVAP